MRIETCRAIRMALYMESIPDAEFDITNWITRLDGMDVYPNTVDPSCGTVCCFIGHLPFVFPEQFAHQNGCVMFRPNMDSTSSFHRYAFFMAPEFFDLTKESMDKVISKEYYTEGRAVSKSVVVGRFLDYVKQQHGIEDMDAAINSVRGVFPISIRIHNRISTTSCERQ